ncbi:MAG: 3-phosphoshikimate 1-carboxyvinyltransferase, partial [Ilumatobacteraceae bacterium]
FVTALAALGPGPYTVDGFGPLRARPMADLHAALSTLGATVVHTERAGHLPVVLSRSGLTGGTIRLPGDVTSQYVTALMLIAPYLPGGLRIELTSPLVSRPYLEITSAVMAAFGHGDVQVGDEVITVGPGAYRACRYVIEPDASSASYPFAVAAVCGGQVTVVGLGDEPLQGDAAFVDVLEAMGCEVERTAEATTVRRRTPLRGVEVDMRDISDTVPTLAAIAPFADSPTTITGIGFIRHKESDRIGDVLRELARCGIAGAELPDGMRIDPGDIRPASLATHHDHRLAMAFAVIGLARPGIAIEDPAVVSKSYPGFWTMIESLRRPQ